MEVRFCQHEIQPNANRSHTIFEWALVWLLQAAGKSSAFRQARKTICDHSNLLVAPLFRLETEILETMLLFEQMNSFYYVDLWLNLEKNYSTKKAICGFVIKKIHYFYFFDILGSTRCTKSMWVVVFFLIYEDPIDASSELCEGCSPSIILLKRETNIT